MKTMENNILSKIESTLDAKITAITDSVLQKAHENNTQNTAAIIEIQSQLTPLKEDMTSNNETVQEVIETMNDVTERIAKCKKNGILNDMRLKSIEDEIGDKTYQMSYSDKRKIRNIEFQIASLQAKVLNTDDVTPVETDNNTKKEVVVIDDKTIKRISSPNHNEKSKITNT